MNESPNVNPENNSQDSGDLVNSTSEYPQFDPEKAKQLRDEYGQDNSHPNDEETRPHMENSVSEHNSKERHISEFAQGHTEEELDELDKKWEEWLNPYGFSMGRNHGQVLNEMFYDEALDWKFSDFDEFFKADSELFNNNNGKESYDLLKNRTTLYDKLSDSLNTLKQVLGEDDPNYKAATKKIFIDIRNGKYSNARLHYDANLYKYSPIIFGDDAEAIEKDDAERRREKEVKERYEWFEAEKRRLKYENSWENPANLEKLKENYEKIDDDTKTYLRKFVSNLVVLASISGDKEIKQAGDQIERDINQTILDGHDIYLDDRGLIHIDNGADEYRSYDKQRSPFSPNSNSGIIDGDTGGSDQSKPKPNTITPPDELDGFKDW